MYTVRYRRREVPLKQCCRRVKKAAAAGARVTTHTLPASIPASQAASACECGVSVEGPCSPVAQEPRRRRRQQQRRRRRWRRRRADDPRRGLNDKKERRKFGQSFYFGRERNWGPTGRDFFLFFFIICFFGFSSASCVGNKDAFLWQHSSRRVRGVRGVDKTRGCPKGGVPFFFFPPFKFFAARDGASGERRRREGAREM